MSDFTLDKTNLIQDLNKCIDYLSFPESVVFSLSKAVSSSFVYYISKYNKTLKKIKSLHTELLTITSWSFFNLRYTRMAWILSISKAILNFNMYKETILSYIENANFIDKITFDQSGITMNKMVLFLNTFKKNKKYICLNTKKEEIELSLQNVIACLPRCLNAPEVGKTLTIENSHQLEPYDLFDI